MCVCLYSFVLPDTSKKSCQKTRLLKRTASPVFNHTMVYDGFRTEDLKEACVELTVWDHERLADHLVGGLRLGLGSGTEILLALETFINLSLHLSLCHLTWCWFKINPYGYQIIRCFSIIRFIFYGMVKICMYKQYKISIIRTGYAKLPQVWVSVESVHGALQWTGIPSRLHCFLQMCSRDRP